MKKIITAIKLKAGLLLILAVIFSLNAASEENCIEQKDWASYFKEADVRGTIAVFDQRAGKRKVYNANRAKQRFTPASTFKIPHSLFLLDAGIIKDEFQVFEWDKVERRLPTWNQDQTLRSMMRYSALPVYQKLATELGKDREKEYLARTKYGNKQMSENLERFWVDGSLRISAIEQIRFLERLYRNQLPFSEANQRLVKDIMIIESQDGWILRAKTGLGIPEKEPGVGWWVGWVEYLDGPIFFALNIEVDDMQKDAPKRQRIARQVLRSIGAL